MRDVAAEAETGFAIHPMDQFIVSRWFCHDDAGTAINECTADIKWYEITNVTVWMAITVLAIIEVISYFVRPVSHSIRLAGNLMAGHAVMKVFAGFASMAVISPVAIGAVTAIYGLELLVAVVQAYVFTILTCVYLKDAVGGAHH